MPRIDDEFLDCSIYLYPSEVAARKGERAGGSGFLVGIPSDIDPPNLHHIYAVTNSHVVREGGSSVVRINTGEGAVDILPTHDSQWIHHQDGDDVAVCPIILDSTHRFSCVPRHMLLTRELIGEYSIGPGDDVFIVGRFVGAEGQQQNTPTARFGNIAMLPREPIPHPRGIRQESFLVDVRSISGFSGSPAFVYLPPFTRRYGDRNTGDAYRQWLLGLAWGHINDKCIRDNVVDQNDAIIGTVRANTGMLAVVPAWRLADLLSQEPLVVSRRTAEQKWKAARVRA